MLENIKTRICSSCQAETDADAIFCNECGAMQTKSSNNAEWICRDCNKPVAAGDKFCRSCFLNLSSTESVAATSRKTTPEKDNLLKTKNASNVFADGKKVLEINETLEVISSKQPLKEKFNYLESKSNSEEKFFSPNTTSAATKRYKDGYRVAGATDGFGQLIKTIGVLSGLGIGLLGFIISAGAAEQARKSSFGMSDGSGIAFGSILVFGITGALIGIVFWILGVLISAKGQELKASLDGAVHSSPFLSDVEKAQVMSLPLS